MRLNIKRYLLRNAIAEDILWNVRFGGAIETISDSLARKEREGSKAACFICQKILGLFEKDHCQKSHRRKLAMYRQVLSAEDIAPLIPAGTQ